MQGICFSYKNLRRGVGIMMHWHTVRSLELPLTPMARVFEIATPGDMKLRKRPSISSNNHLGRDFTWRMAQPWNVSCRT